MLELGLGLGIGLGLGFNLISKPSKMRKMKKENIGARSGFNEM